MDERGRLNPGGGKVKANDSIARCRRGDEQGPSVPLARYAGGLCIGAISPAVILRVLPKNPDPSHTAA